MNDGRRTLLGLLIIFAVLLVITFLLSGADTQEAARHQSELPFDRVFADWTENDIQAVRLQNAEGDRFLTIVWDTQSNQWLTPDMPGTLDQQAATLIGRTMVLLPYDRTIEVMRASDLPAYGFEPTPTLLIQIVLTNGEQHGVIVGGLSSSGNSYYGLVDNRPAIYLLQSPAIEFLLNLLETPPTA